MAAPPSITIHSLSGAYDLNKTLSDSTSAMLKMQNIGFLVRQAANYSAITVHLSQYPYPENANVVQVDQEQISTGNMKQYEPRILDGEVREREIQYWGKVRGWNKYVLSLPFFFSRYVYHTNSIHSFFIQICQTLRNHPRRLVNRRMGSRMFQRTRPSPIEFYRKCGEWVDGVSSLGVCDC